MGLPGMHGHSFDDNTSRSLAALRDKDDGTARRRSVLPRSYTAQSNYARKMADGQVLPRSNKGPEGGYQISTLGGSA